MKQMALAGDVLSNMPAVGDNEITEGRDAVQSLRRIQGIIDAMTKKERGSMDILDHPRCRRIAAGAGVLPQEVEQFLDQFRQVRVLMEQMAQMSIWPETGA
jgi:signal recognition particle subunit SRP54